MAWAKKSYPKMARGGSKNGRWIDGSSQPHYRNKTKAKSGQVVHHSDGNKKNNNRSNLRLVSKSQHNKDHPEKVAIENAKVATFGVVKLNHA